MIGLETFHSNQSPLPGFRASIRDYMIPAGIRDSDDYVPWRHHLSFQREWDWGSIPWGAANFRSVEMSMSVDPNLVCWDGYPSAAWERQSLAVVVSDGDGTGLVLWTAGPHIRMEMEEGGFKCLDELYLDKAPFGISVWVGRLTWNPGGWENPSDGETVPCPTNHFREPTEEEWVAIREKRCPWNDQDWRIQGSVPTTAIEDALESLGSET